MKKQSLIWALSLLLYVPFSLSAEEKTVTLPSDTAPKNMVKKSVDDDFETTKENLELAITGKGLRVSGTLHVSEMLNRTGKDLGFNKQIFAKAESIEFCSALISHKMAVADPANISICPFTIAVYSYTEKPEQVHVSYRIPHLLGDADEVSDDIKTLLADILEEATE